MNLYLCLSIASRVIPVLVAPEVCDQIIDVILRLGNAKTVMMPNLPLGKRN